MDDMTEDELAAIEADHGACPPVEWRDCYDGVQKRCAIQALVAEVRRLHQVIGSTVLTARERAVLSLRAQGQTYQAIGKTHGISRERVRQIETAARRRVRWIERAATNATT